MDSEQPQDQAYWQARNRRALYFGLGLVIALLAILAFGSTATLNNHRIAEQERAKKLKRLVDELESKADYLEQAAKESELKQQAFDLHMDAMTLQREMRRWTEVPVVATPTVAPAQ